MKHLLLVIGLSILLLFYCDKGLSPETQDSIAPEDTITGISGTVFFQNWPPQDSLKDLRVVVFKNFPPQDILSEIVNGNAFFYPEGGIAADSSHLPFYVDNVNFRFELPPGTYEYVVIAHLFGNNPLADWQAVGQYDTDSDSLPTPVALGEEQLLENILINVDFDNLPIQPF